MWLQIGAYDCRHSAQALANVCKQLAAPNQVLHIWVYEETPEILAKHMLLLSVLLDTKLPVRQRTELFLELHNNASIQTTTAEYLGDLVMPVLVGNINHAVRLPYCFCHLDQQSQYKLSITTFPAHTP